MKTYAKITIGIPVYNSEKFIKKHIETLLTQTFQNFSIIISDNGSTDDTTRICEEISNNDNRIMFYRHEENKGAFWNFNFIINKATTEYFVMSAPDDLWSRNFLESNITNLDKNDKLVGSIGECSVFVRKFNSIKNYYDIEHLTNKIKFQYVHAVQGNLSQKIKFFLMYNMGSQYYSVFRTKDIQFANFYKEEKNYGMWQSDFATILKILKNGDLSVTTDSFFHKEVSQTSKSIIQYMKKMGFKNSEILFSKLIFSNWFFNEFGTKIFFNNISTILKLNLSWSRTIIGEILRMIKRRIAGKEQYW